jgi:hypothetical protein
MFDFDVAFCRQDTYVFVKEKSRFNSMTGAKVISLQESADKILFLIQDVTDAIMRKRLDLYLFAFVELAPHVATEEIAYAEIFLQDLRTRQEHVLRQISHTVVGHVRNNHPELRNSALDSCLG